MSKPHRPGKIKENSERRAEPAANFGRTAFARAGYSWSPDGKQMALASKAGETGRDFYLDVSGNEPQRKAAHIDVDGIGRLKCRPMENISRSSRQKRPIGYYLYDNGDEQLEISRNDVFSDHEPSWRRIRSRFILQANAKIHLTPASIRILIRVP